MRMQLSKVFLIMVYLIFSGCSSAEFASDTPKKAAEKKTADSTQTPATTSPSGSNPNDITSPSGQQDPQSSSPIGDTTTASSGISAPESNPTVEKVGSFTVWAEPSNPSRGQNYYIHILVDLPSNVTSYTINDLRGSIEGTDSWKQSIAPFPTGASLGLAPLPLPTPKIRVQNGTAEVIYFVPGAQEPKTQDYVKINSNILNESQDITVNFGGNF